MSHDAERGARGLIRKIEHVVRHTLDSKRVILFNPYTFQVLVVTPEVDLLLQRLFGPRARHEITGQLAEQVPRLISAGFLVPLDYDEGAHVRSMSTEAACPTDVSTLFVVPTMGCNLACRYCFVYQRGRDFPDKNLTWETFLMGVDAYLRSFDHAREGLNRVVFYGGEPLLRTGFVERVMVHLEEARRGGAFGPRELAFGLSTNGTLVTEESARMLGRHQVMTSVSLDGDPGANVLRVSAGPHQQTFEAAVEGLELLERHGVHTIISVVIGRHNLETLGAGLQWFQENLQTRRLSINFVNRRPGGDLRDEGASLSRQDVELVYRTIYARGFVENSVEAYREVLGDRVLGAPHCGAVGGHMILRPDGKVSLCTLLLDSDRTAVALERGTNLSEEPTWQEWGSRRALDPRMSRCHRRCSYFSTCTGGCPYESLARHGDIWTVNEEECDRQKAAINVALELLATA